MTDYYKLASMKKLMFETDKGRLNIYDLWDLSLSDLNDTAMMLDDKLKKDRKSFLEVETQEDATIRLKFNIVLDVIETRQNSVKEKLARQEKQEKAQVYKDLLRDAELRELKALSPEELKAKLAELDA